MKTKLHIKLGIFLIVLFIGGGTSVKAGVPVLDIRFNADKNTLSVHADNIPLFDVLKDIGGKLDCEMFWYADQEAKISQTFSNLPVEQAIQRLARNFSIAMIYQIIDTTGRSQYKFQKIKEIWLFPGKNKGGETTARRGNNTSLQKTIPEGQTIALLPDTSKTDKNDQTGNTPSAQLLRTINLQEFGEDSPVGFWSKKLLEATQRDDRQQAITELQRTGSEEAVPIIATVLGDRDVGMRRYAVESLTLMENGKARQIIGQALLGDPDVSVRKVALNFFANRGDQVSQAFLKAALRDRSEQIRSLAQKNLDDL